MPYSYIDISFKWREDWPIETIRFMADVKGIATIAINEQWESLSAIVYRPNGQRLTTPEQEFVGGILGQMVIPFSNYGTIDDVRP